ncbi:hypothetical protein DFO70_10585 [Cytobacillus firmus]|uniref:Uncharacterized protein n=2 Tax=Cytobacillus TaxID=2675230 RepID=A0A366JWG0_CYTFI|nr:hypothetical protein DFO70_10585 [Cytobacillus firmus]TDX47730.1 hypothetical protein DFO72_101846 [Cytobacillus oceanisediminis]
MILENATAFSSCSVVRGSIFNVLRDERELRDPAWEAEEALIPPCGKQVPRAEISGHHLLDKQHSIGFFTSSLCTKLVNETKAI